MLPSKYLREAGVVYLIMTLNLSIVILSHVMRNDFKSQSQETNKNESENIIQSVVEFVIRQLT